MHEQQAETETTGPLLNRRGELLTNNTEKAEVLNTFFPSVLNCVLGSQATGTKMQVDGDTDSLSVKEELVCHPLQELHLYKSMGLDAVSLRMLRELADVLLRAHFGICEDSWRSANISEDWKEANVTFKYKKGSKEDTGNSRPIRLTSVLGKVMKQILLGRLSQVS